MQATLPFKRYPKFPIFKTLTHFTSAATTSEITWYPPIAAHHHSTLQPLP